jgi:membrane protease YdiL (CAAX protease family)
MLKIIKSNKEYNDNLKKYDKKDGMLAILLFAIIIIMYALLGILYKNNSFIKENIKIVGCIFNFLLIIITIIFVKSRKQRLNTIGLNGRWKLSLIIGLILSLFYFYCNCLSHLLEGRELISISEILFLAIYFLLVSVCEELVFRGYIGTRLNGLIKNKYIALFITGILFVVMHFPYRMIAANMSLSDFDIGWLINLFIFHLIMSFIYMKSNSIYGSIIPHWISDLAYEIVSK